MYRTQLELLEHIYHEEQGRPLQESLMENMRGADVIDLLLPMSEMFIPVINQISGIPYQTKYTKDADQAIKEFALKNTKCTWEDLPAEVWRILLERHIQTITLCAEKSHLNSLMFIPVGMTDRSKLKYVVVFWWYAMKLPYKVDEESTHDTLSRFHHLTGKHR